MASKDKSDIEKAAKRLTGTCEKAVPSAPYSGLRENLEVIFVAVVIAAIAVYGVTAESVARRRGEMAVRMALGARSRDLQRLVDHREGRTKVTD